MVLETVVVPVRDATKLVVQVLTLAKQQDCLEVVAERWTTDEDHSSRFGI